MSKTEILYLVIVIYVVGFFISLIILHKFGKQLEWDHYDPPHCPYYDDYDSNAQAYVAFSTFWFLFWTFNGLFGIGRLTVRLSENIGKKFNTK